MGFSFFIHLATVPSLLYLPYYFFRYPITFTLSDYILQHSHICTALLTPSAFPPSGCKLSAAWTLLGLASLLLNRRVL